MKITYVKEVACPIGRTLVEKALALAEHDLRRRLDAVEVVAVGNKTMQRLNNHYRGKDAPTDVLSFAWGETATPGPSPLGAQIYLNYPYIVRQARDFSVPVKEEFVRMLIHGLLHSLGFDHDTPRRSKPMFALQEKIVGRIFSRL